MLNSLQNQNTSKKSTTLWPSFSSNIWRIVFGCFSFKLEVLNFYKFQISAAKWIKSSVYACFGWSFDQINQNKKNNSLKFGILSPKMFKVPFKFCLHNYHLPDMTLSVVYFTWIAWRFTHSILHIVAMG